MKAVTGELIKDNKSSAKVKVTRSYSGCHFQVSLYEKVESLDDVDRLRKDASKIMDNAISQFKEVKGIEEWKSGRCIFFSGIEEEVEKILRKDKRKITKNDIGILEVYQGMKNLLSVEYSYDGFDYDEYNKKWTQLYKLYEKIKRDIKLDASIWKKIFNLVLRWKLD